MSTPGTAHSQAESFFRACESGDLKRCKALATSTSEGEQALLDHHDYPQLNRRPFSGYGRLKCPALHAAAWNGHTEVVKFLVEICNVDVDEQIDASRQESDVKMALPARTALFQACEAGHVDTARTLLEAGAHLHLGLCAYQVVQFGKAALLRLLYDFGANPENTFPLSFPKAPPLHVAILNGHPDILEILFQNGCSIYPENKLSISLCIAPRRRNNEEGIFRTLCRYTHEAQLAQCFIESINQNDFYTLGHFSAVGGTLNWQNEYGITPILALLRRYEWLNPHEYKSSFRKSLVLRQAIVLIHHGQPDPAVGNHYEECFELTIKAGNWQLLRWILHHWKIKYGDNKPNEHHNHPLHVACQISQTSFRTVEFLFHDHPQVLDIADGDNGHIPVHSACVHGLDLDVIYTLLRHKPDTLPFKATKIGGCSCPKATSRMDELPQRNVPPAAKRQKF